MFLIRRAAVLGAGAMGSGIAAHLANAGIPTLLLDIVPGELTDEERKKGWDLTHPRVRNRFSEKGLEAARKARLAAFAHPERAGLVTPGNFEDDLPRLREVDWVVEAVVERLDVKVDLLQRVSEHLSSDALLTTNTSGLSVNAMADALPEALKSRFFGTHFFNPPRYMHLLELVPGASTSGETLSGFQEFAETRLGKGVVLAKDTPNFVANRIGIFATVYAMRAMEKHGLGIEEVDAVTGKALGRASSATFGTVDLAGIDLLPHVVRTQRDGAPRDECRDQMTLPPWIEAMIGRGWLGQKSGSGFYKDKRALVFDPGTLAYRPARKVLYGSLSEAAKTADPGVRIAGLVRSDDAAGRFAWDVTAATLLYAAHRIPEVADDLVSVDRAMRWGFGWELGPFELWDALGVQESVERMTAEGRDVPDWVKTLASSANPRFYEAAGATPLAWTPRERAHRGFRSDARAISLSDRKLSGKTLLEDECASLVDLGDGVACLEFHTKMNTLSEPLTAFIEAALGRAGKDYRALVVGNQGTVFSAGADLRPVGARALAGDWQGIDEMVRGGQRMVMKLKYAPVPVVAAPFERVLGGGLEVCLHSHRIQASQEVFMGLVEVGVGLIPAAGGTKEALLRTPALAAAPGSRAFALGKAFETILTARVTASAWEGFDLGFLRAGDGVTMNRDHLLHAPRSRCSSAAGSPWRRPPSR
ncbi:MAG: 3-hydroxyacyl-CoA dehydrogenase/enoyl-CoA hydratase family protein [Deltaproteobacteria bacterium]|nr:3-hydroxyacyl-CoA dehydrogenase/enoyl-CoA hydratase family protein [Deltaproteobacteria bacterium]